MVKCPKLPCIELIAKCCESYDRTLSVIDAIPYIDKNTNYPTNKDGTPLICQAQLNMGQIFNMLKNKKSESKLLNHFKKYPQTGLLQFYLEYSETLDDGEIKIIHIPNFNKENHDFEKEKELNELYKSYHEKHGPLYDKSDNDEINCHVCICDAFYCYKYLNSSNQSHELYEELFGDGEFEGKNDFYFEECKVQTAKDNMNYNSICIGGYPQHLQDDFEFNDNEEICLFSLINSILGLNIAINKKSLKKLNFEDTKFDLAYD
jgi:uncharacterized protein YwqG